MSAAPIDLDIYRAHSEARSDPSLSRYAPDWHSMAECAGEDAPRPWEYTEDFFEDEVNTTDYRQFPGPLLDTMEICAACPVRRECLAEAYAQEVHIAEDKKRRPHLVEDGTRFGVWGGIPGRVRTRFASHPDRLDAAEEWFQMVARELRFGFRYVLDDLFTRARQGQDEAVMRGPISEQRPRGGQRAG